MPQFTPILTDENVAVGLPQTSPYKAGISNVDPGLAIEEGFKLPGITGQANGTFVMYQCWIENLLDAGIAIHRTLPQGEYAPDQLGTTFVDDPKADMATKGINIVSGGRFTHVAQRMADSVYRFALRGYGVRYGYQVPIPKLRTVGGVEAIPDERQWCYNRPVGAWGGIPIWQAEWDLHYVVIVPPTRQQVPPPNLADHIRGDAELPTQVQVPYSQPDSNSQPSAPGLPRQLRGT